MCHACREHVNTDENLIYARLCLSPWEVGEQLERGGYPGWLHSRKDKAATTFDSKLFKGIFGSVFANPNRITDFNGQTLGRFDTQQLLDWLSSCYSPGVLGVIAKGAQTEAKMGIFPLQSPPSPRLTHHHLHPSLLPPHLLPSSERCISLLIFLRLAKAG